MTPRAIATALFVSLCAGVGRGGEVAPADRNAAAGADPSGATVKKVVYLDQDWSPGDSLRFNSTPLGSQIIPYDWFLALEQPNRATPFRDNPNLARFGYLIQRPGASNPDGLPIGFVKDNGRDRAWLGITCATCHTAQIDFAGVGYRIDGGPALADLGGFLRSLTAALGQMLNDTAKFDRFAAKVLGPEATFDRRQALHGQVTLIFSQRDGYNQRNFPTGRGTDYGRLDALGITLNEVLHRALNPQERALPTANARPPDAPASYPFLWDTPQHDRVQWIGAIPIGGFRNVGGLARNVQESFCAMADLELSEDLRAIAYPSSIKVANLQDLDQWLTTLWSPRWPADFPALDQAKVGPGKVLYDKYCLQCHDRIDRSDPYRRVVAKMAATGTNQLAANNYWSRRGRSGSFEGRFFKVFPGTSVRIGREASGWVILSNAVIGTILGSTFGARPEDLTTITMNARATDEIQKGALYKARPLNGIWATAPYLHNGSVPNLAELLRRSGQRPLSFSVGIRASDPDKVGFQSDVPGSPRFSVNGPDGRPIPGNSNEGHEYGTELTDYERMNLLEYLQTL